MKLPRARFTLRGMMAAVAACALAIGAERLWRCSVYYAGLAPLHAREERSHDELARSLAGDPATASSPTVTALLPDGTAVRFDGHGPRRRLFYPPDAAAPADEATAARLAALCRRRADHHGAIRREYERIARYPWLPVAPDPPEPD